MKSGGSVALTYHNNQNVRYVSHPHAVCRIFNFPEDAKECERSIKGALADDICDPSHYKTEDHIKLIESASTAAWMCLWQTPGALGHICMTLAEQILLGWGTNVSEFRALRTLYDFQKMSRRLYVLCVSSKKLACPFPQVHLSMDQMNF